MAFYQAIGDDRFRSTEHTVGPWDPAHQHGGPPSALLARAIDRCAHRPDARIARITVEILGPVPVDDVATRARVVRPGRRVELIEGELDAGGRTVLRATAWRIRTAELELSGDAGEPPPPPESVPESGPGPSWFRGYIAALEWRWLHGSFTDPGPARVWARMRHPLVEGEAPAPLERVLVLADSGNGASGRLDATRWLYVNPELTVHVVRPAEGEWVLLDAATALAADGIGVAASVLADRRGEIGRGAQALYVAPRG